MRMANFLALCATCALGACAGDGKGLDQNGRPLTGDDSGELQPTFQSIQEQVFTPICTACHAGAAAPVGLRLDAASSYALLVNASSVEVPSLLRVQPGNPDESYLIQKLEGRAAVGGRMPLNGPALPQATIDVIRQWITNGAANDTNVTGATSGANDLDATDVTSNANATAGLSVKPRVEIAKLSAVSPLNGEAMAATTRDIVVTSNVELDVSLLQSDLVTLRASGGDGEFQSGNESFVPVEVAIRSRQPTVLAITPRLTALPADTYELRISGTDPVALADLQARAIDGDDDGSPGGDFVVRFTVEMTR